MMTGLQARTSWRREAQGAAGRLRLHRRRSPLHRRGSLARFYGRCFSGIKIGQRREVPAFIQVDCRGSSPPATVRRISRACGTIGRGDWIELLTTDMAAVIAALSWCSDEGGAVERMESTSGAYVLDMTAAGGRVGLAGTGAGSKAGLCTQVEASPYDGSPKL